MNSGAGLIRKFGDRVATLLTDRDAAENGRAIDDAAALHVTEREFERHLACLLHDQAQPLAGRVNFIGLSKIREKLGDRWDHVAARADEIARRAIERRLTNADVYTRYKELQYLIIFAALTKDQAQLKCALIAEEITKRLLGEDVAPDLLEVKTMVSVVDGDFRFEDVPTIDSLAGRLSELPETDEAAPGKPAARADAAGEDESDDRWWQTDDAGSDPLAELHLVYRPMWDVKRNVITTYVSAPACPGPAGRLRVGESEFSCLDDPVVVHRLDFLVQRRVITDLRRLVSSNRHLLLCLPVHFETLAASHSRAEYIALCRRGVPAQGAKFLMFELTGIPAGVPQNRLLELSAMLRNFARGVLVRTTLDHLDFRPPAETGVAGAGFEYRLRGLSEAREIQDMERFAVAAKKAGLVAYVHGLQSVSLTTAAIGAGFDFVDGDIVTSVVERPRDAYSYEVSDLFASPSAASRAGGSPSRPENPR